MFQSKLFGKTLKETPREAKTASHKLLLRGGYIDQLTSGVYSMLPLGLRVQRKIEAIVRQEVNKLGAQEVQLSLLQPKNLWQETGRWETFDPPLFKVKDRHAKELALGPTHEEVITDLVRRQVKSYKDLPLALYQIQTKVRNEMRATGGLLRVRELVMKDLYSFHSSEDDLREFYEKVKRAYLKIYQRCGLEVLPIRASAGTIGGDISHEFACLAETGEDKVGSCDKCGYAANKEFIGLDKKNCPECGSQLSFKNAIETGHIFNLGVKYSRAMKANFRNQAGQTKPIIMGCYGLGIGRLLATVVEIHHDKKGIIWPQEVAPFEIHLIPIGVDVRVNKTTSELYQKLIKEGREVLYDDRTELSAGEKFADSDLLGLPLRLVISEKTLVQDKVELKRRDQEKARLIKKELVTKLPPGL